MPGPSLKRPVLALSRAVLPALLLLVDPGEGAAAADHTTVVAWNNLGMHCMDDDFSVFSLLPPYNVLYAQVVRNGQLVTNPAGLTVTYEAVADPQGSINKSSIGKTDFWSHVNELFGAPLAPDAGLAGFDMPGAANAPQPMTFDAASDAFVADGIPITPYDDNMQANAYPMLRVTVRDALNQVLATTDVVLPVSDEMDCRACHASGSQAAAEPTAGWVNDPDPDRDHRLNILLLHDEFNSGKPVYAAALLSAGYNANGLYPTVTASGISVLCARCHLSNALPGTGTPPVAPLTAAIHGRHAGVLDPANGLTLDQSANRSACYRCHPGSETRCLRGAMGAAVAADGTLQMQCQDCHGSMSAVGAEARDGWLDEPACQHCHTGTATNNNGKIRYTSAFDPPGQFRVPVDLTFATNPDTPAPGKSLYRLSQGHGDLLCEACHGATHAIYPSSHVNDNVQSIALQGHKGTLGECSACHDGQPDTTSGGPHGMHPVGSGWAHDHNFGSSKACRACHGADYRGSVLSQAFGARTLNTEFGVLKLWRGFRVTCYACHDGPDSESETSNHPAHVTDAAEATDNATPVEIKLKATDQDNDALALRIVEQPAQGTVGLTGKTATYYPAPGFIGTATFTFAAFDGKTDSNLGTAAVEVEDGACPAALSDKERAFDVTGGVGSFEVAIPGGCDWSALVNAASSAWLTIQGAAAGNGPGSVFYSVAASAAQGARSGTVTVNGKVHKVHQGGLGSADLDGAFLKVKEKCPSSGCYLKLILKVHNAGGSEADKSVARVYLSSDAVFDAGDELLREKNYGKIAAGKSLKKSFSADLPGGASASAKYVIAVIDAGKGVVEADETDNEAVFGPLP